MGRNPSPILEAWKSGWCQKSPQLGWGAVGGSYSPPAILYPATLGDGRHQDILRYAKSQEICKIYFPRHFPQEVTRQRATPKNKNKKIKNPKNKDYQTKGDHFGKKGRATQYTT